MIVLFTDFGLHGPYTGRCTSQCAAVQHSVLANPLSPASRPLAIGAILGGPHEALAPVAAPGCKK
jgi:hypothetical protein